MNKFIFEIDQQKNSKKGKCIMGKQPFVIGQNTKDNDNWISCMTTLTICNKFYVVRVTEWVIFD